MLSKRSLKLIRIQLLMLQYINNWGRVLLWRLSLTVLPLHLHYVCT